MKDERNEKKQQKIAKNITGSQEEDKEGRREDTKMDNQEEKKEGIRRKAITCGK